MFDGLVVGAAAAFGIVLSLCQGVATAATGPEVKQVGPEVQQVGLIKRVEGVAMLTQGADYVEALSGMQLYDLDRIMVLDESSAELELAGGCTYEMQGARMVTLQAGDTCETVAARLAEDLEARSQLGREPVAAAPDDTAGLLLGPNAGLGILAGAALVGAGAALGNATDSDDRRSIPITGGSDRCPCPISPE